MGDHAPSLALYSSLVAALGYALLIVHLARSGYLRRQADAIQRTLLAATAASVFWAVMAAVAEASAYTGPGYIAAGVDLLRYAGWLGLLVLLLRVPARVDRALESPPPTAPAPLLAVKAAPPQRGVVDLLTWAGALLLCVAVIALAYRMLQAIPQVDAERSHLMPQLGLAVLGLVLVEQVYRNLAHDTRWSAKPLCLGLASLFAFDVYLYAEAALLGRLDPDAVAVRPLLHLILVPFLYIAVKRTADWSRRIQVSRRAVFYSAALLLAGAYLLFLSAVGYYVRYFGGDWGRALQLGLAFAGGVGLLVLILSASLRAKVRVFIGKHFFSYRYDYREEWLAFTAMLASNSSPQQVGELVIRALANIVECPAGSLWTRMAGASQYSQSACWNVPTRAEAVPSGDPLVTFLRERTWLIDVDEFRRDPGAYETLELPPWLRDSDKAWAIIPLPAGADLLGWVVLAPPRTPLELDWETRDLVKTASRQAAGYLAQMQATEALLESRKFDAFNRMSAFVVHDLKNIVTQQSLMLKNAQRLRDNPEFQQDMLLTVESSLDKMRRLMLQLREGATPPDGARGVELQAIVGKLQRLAVAAGRVIEARIDEPLATRGHEERLERVLGHLVQNALDATPPDGRVWLKVERYSGQVRVEVGDTGQGMSEDFVRTKLFKPFSSTKRSGMGIGMYESAQYIRELGGSIDVDSAPGRGTVLSVLLPLLDVQRGSDLRAASAP
jgi:putative PEP-CTERM system histidine kinase